MKSVLYLAASSLLLLFSDAALVQKRAPTPLATTTADWKSRTIYQLLTDRFAKTDGSTDACSNLSGYCGGTYQGIINHLDYIAGMGFDAIWISPIPQNSDKGYHGYWATDFGSLNPNFGTSQDLKDLVNAAHDKNILVMLDVVANHAGIPSSSGDYTGYTFSSASQYHASCDIDYNNQTSVEQCWISGLPDIDTEDSNIVNTLYNVVGNWISTYGFDGLRIDTFKHVRKDFWPGYISSANVFATGEVLSGDASYVGPYQDYAPSLINYPLYYPINNAFAFKKAMSALANQITTNQNNFKDISVLTTFVDNHDNVRFLSQTSDTSLFKNALAFILMTEGIPVYYYGSEQGFTGGSDPANREALWTSSYDTTSDLYKFTAKLIKDGRKKANGTVVADVDVQDSIYAFTRGSALVILNNQGNSATNSISVKVGAGISDGSKLTDIFTNTTVTVSGGTITYHLQNGLPSIFM